MDSLFSPIREFFRKGDWVLLSLCLLASGYGLVLIYSATRYMESNRSVIVQAASIVIGVFAYIFLTFVDFHTLTEKGWKPMMIFSILFVLLVRTPIGVEIYGNRNWIRVPGIPITIQPDEVVKISLILLLALRHLQTFYPLPFELQAVTIDAGFPDMDFSPVEKL